MKTVEQLRNVAQDLIASYDARLDAVGTIIDNAYQILDDFKEKRAKLSAELRETLAKRESLRKKDFDRMMNGILLSHEEREKKIKQDLRNFLVEQKKEARELKDALLQGEVDKMKRAQIGIERGIAEVRGLLKGFYEEQEGLARELRKLLTKGDNLKIKDLKKVTRNLQTGEKGERKMGLHDVATDVKALGQDMAACHVDRKKTIEALQDDVREMLTDFQKENAQRKAEVSRMFEEFDELMEEFHKENAKSRKEVHQLLRGVQQFMKGVQSESAQRRAEVTDLLATFQGDMKTVRNEVMALAAATKEMWSTVAGVKGGAKKVSAHRYAEPEPKKPAKRAKGKARK